MDHVRDKDAVWQSKTLVFSKMLLQVICMSDHLQDCPVGFSQSRLPDAVLSLRHLARCCCTYLISSIKFLSVLSLSSRSTSQSMGNQRDWHFIFFRKAALLRFISYDELVFHKSVTEYTKEICCKPEKNDDTIKRKWRKSVMWGESNFLMPLCW